MTLNIAVLWEEECPHIEDSNYIPVYAANELSALCRIRDEFASDAIAIDYEGCFFGHGNGLLLSEQMADLLCDHDCVLPINGEGQMVIIKKGDFCRYVEWLLREKRLVTEGCLQEWIDQQGFAVGRESVIYTRAEAFKSQISLPHRVHEYLSIEMKGLIAAYMSGERLLLADACPQPVDLENRIPIWVCWWQGRDSMPLLVGKCVESIERNMVNSLTRMHLITFDNVNEYIKLPSYIIEKVRNGTISYTHLSDILRMILLYYYGGMWIDATYYVMGKISESFFLQSFYTIRKPKPIFILPLFRNQWSFNLALMKEKNVLAEFVMNAFFAYWAAHDELVDYYLIDHMILLAYENIPEVSEMIDGCEPSEYHVFEMDPILDERYDEEIFRRLTTGTSFFKLSYKNDHFYHTDDGAETFYGKITGR